MDDEEQHGGIVNFMFWFFLIGFILVALVLMGGPG